MPIATTPVTERIPARAPGILVSHLPLELMHQICDHLTRRDILQLRVALPRIAEVSLPLVFDQITIGFRVGICERSLNIARSPRLSKYVKTVVFDAAAASKTPWAAEFRYSHTLSMLLGQMGILDAHIDAGWSQRRKNAARRELMDDAQKQWPEPTLKRMYDKGRQIWLEESAAVTDLTPFAVANEILKSCVNITGLILTARKGVFGVVERDTGSHTGQYKECSASDFFKEDPEAFTSTMVHRRPCAAPPHILRHLVPRFVSHNRPLKTLQVCSVDGETSRVDISYILRFQEARGNIPVLEQLERLDIRFIHVGWGWYGPSEYPLGGEPDDHEAEVPRGTYFRWTNAMQNLKVLRFSFRGRHHLQFAYKDGLEILLRQLDLPQLQRVSFGDFITYPLALLAFIENHRATLVEMILHDVTLRHSRDEQDWIPPEAGICSIWVAVLLSIKALGPQALRLFVLDGKLICNMRYPKSCNCYDTCMLCSRRHMPQKLMWARNKIGGPATSLLIEGPWRGITRDTLAMVAPWPLAMHDRKWFVSERHVALEDMDPEGGPLTSYWTPRAQKIFESRAFENVDI